MNFPLNKYVYELKNKVSGKIIYVREILGPNSQVVKVSTSIGKHATTQRQKAYNHVDYTQYKYSDISPIGTAILAYEEKMNGDRVIRFKGSNGELQVYAILKKTPLNVYEKN